MQPLWNDKRIRVGLWVLSVVVATAVGFHYGKLSTLASFALRRMPPQYPQPGPAPNISGGAPMPSPANPMLGLPPGHPPYQMMQPHPTPGGGLQQEGQPSAPPGGHGYRPPGYPPGIPFPPRPENMEQLRKEYAKRAQDARAKRPPSPTVKPKVTKKPAKPSAQ